MMDVSLILSEGDRKKSDSEEKEMNAAGEEQDREDIGFLLR